MIFTTFKASASRHVIAAALAISMLVPAHAFAQSAKASPIFAPASSWSVGSTALSNVRGLGNMKMPCVLSTEYDNGFVVRFSGGGGKMMAMAVDFRQEVFTKGRKYSSMISVGDAYAKQVTATAFTNSTLIFNLRPLNDFYQTIKNGGTLGIDIEDNSMSFALNSIGASFAALESCYAGKETAPVEPIAAGVKSAAVPAVEASPVAAPSPTNIASEPAPLLPSDVAAKPLPQSFDDIVKGADAAQDNAPTPVLPAGQMKVSQVTPRGPEQKPVKDSIIPPQKISRASDVAPERALTAQKPAEPMVISPRVENAPRPAAPMPASVIAAPEATEWNAKAGEDMKIVLARWSERAGYDLQWQSDQDGKVAQDMQLKGSFEEAVTQLLAENSAATGIGGHVQMTDGVTKDLSRKAAMPPMPQGAPTQAVIPAMQADWNAPAGANIQSVLDQWGTKAGVTVVWQDYMSVPVKSPVEVSGSFEQAVQSLLDQYTSEANRPVGRLNTDPDSGKRTLLMSLEKAS
jgi:hypothetical protein